MPETLSASRLALRHGRWLVRSAGAVGRRHGRTWDECTEAAVRWLKRAKTWSIGKRTLMPETRMVPDLRWDVRARRLVALWPDAALCDDPNGCCDCGQLTHTHHHDHTWRPVLDTSGQQEARDPR